MLLSSNEAKPGKKPKLGALPTRVRALPERSHLEITYPRVLGYRYEIKSKKLVANFANLQFYSNEHFPLDWVKELGKLGYDVLTSQEVGQANNQSISDPDVLKFAHQNQRVVIILNRQDFLLNNNQSLKGRLIRIKKENKKASQSQSFVIKHY
jgi:hypothetical protein